MNDPSIPCAHGFNQWELTELFEYLDELRESGRTNMWAAGAFVERDLLWPPDEADRGTGLWMNTFARDQTVAERVAQAMSAGTAKTPKAVEGDSPPARSEGCAQGIDHD